jgi:geranylgeranyl diphosphate synthase type I
MGVEPFLDYLAEVKPAIDLKLRSYLQDKGQGSLLRRYLYDILQEFVARGGKRVRPAMAMLACEAVGGDAPRALPSGCAVEFFHAAALIHDDIMDESEIRRERTCTHIQYGVPLAINTGDYALGLVCTIVVRDEGLDDRTKIAVLDAIGEMSARTIEGQALDVGWVEDERYDLAPADYLEMALGKTGYYSGISPLKIGGLIGGATAQEQEALEAFGRNSAIAFQIQDDLLNIVGDEAVVGKDLLNDILESKRTLMVIHCLNGANEADRARLTQLLRMGHAKEPDHVREVVGLLERYGSIEYARRTARDLIVEARSHLSVLAASRARDVLGSMADFFLEREL